MTRLEDIKREFLVIVAECEDDASDENVKEMTSDELLELARYAGNQHDFVVASGYDSKYDEKASKRYFDFYHRYINEPFIEDNLAVLKKRYKLEG